MSNSLFGPLDPAPDAGWAEAPPRKGFFTDTSICIGCKACEVACKEWNAVPEDGLSLTGMSYDNSQGLGASTWRHVAFVEQRVQRGTGDAVMVALTAFPDDDLDAESDLLVLPGDTPLLAAGEVAGLRLELGLLGGEDLLDPGRRQDHEAGVVGPAGVAGVERCHVVEQRRRAGRHAGLRASSTSRTGMSSRTG